VICKRIAATRWASRSAIRTVSIGCSA